MGIFITSDLHFGHKRVSEIRGFNSIEEHDSTLIYRWNKRVSEEDIVYVLGDVMMGNKDLGRECISRLNGTRHLILGNHDRAAPNNKNGHLHYAEMGSWESISNVATLSYNGRHWYMSHYPYDGDHTRKDRYEEWRLKDLGKPLLHGHTHSNKNFSLSSKGTPQVHVGLDAWDLYPVPIFEATQLAKEYI